MLTILINIQIPAFKYGTSCRTKELKKIPGVGDIIAEDLWNIGINSIEQLKNKNPELLYKKLEAIKNKKVDKCMLYVFRCVVYYASNNTHNPYLLKWWNWKEKKL